MSYIRQGQDGSYIEIPGGSNYYLYGNGDSISGWSRQEFGALIAGVLDEIEWPEGYNEYGYDGRIGRMIFAFEEYFDGLDYEYEGGISPPERGEIFCQCVDRRLDGVELTDDLQEAVQEWAAEFDALRECDSCGDMFRPMFYNDDSMYICEKKECGWYRNSKHYGVSVECVKKAERIFGHLHYDYGWSIEDASHEELCYIFTDGDIDE